MRLNGRIELIRGLLTVAINARRRFRPQSHDTLSSGYLLHGDLDLSTTLTSRAPLIAITQQHSCHRVAVLIGIIDRCLSELRPIGLLKTSRSVRRARDETAIGAFRIIRVVESTSTKYFVFCLGSAGQSSAPNLDRRPPARPSLSDGLCRRP